jgi:hypothetical protein
MESHMATHRFTRQELYDLAWSEPMTKLAARYRLSGNGLAKACRRADIPVPQRGYWAKLQAGRKVAKTPLPSAKADTPSSVTIEPLAKKPEPSAPAPISASVREKIDAAKQAGKPVTVPATLANPHRVVAAWLQEDHRQSLQRRHDPHFGRWHKPIDKTDLDKRRLRILSTLFKALEERSYKLIVDSSQYVREVQVALGNDKFSIKLEERIRQVRRQLTEKEKAERSFLSTGQKWTQEKVPTGELILKIAESNRYGITREWRDEAAAPIESKLDDVMAQLAGAFEELRLRQQRDAEERERQWKIEQERYHAEIEQKRELIRIRRLISHCDEWRTAASIRVFVSAIEASPLAAADTEHFAAWKSWALDYAERVDPLQNNNLFDRTVDDYEVYALRD